MYRVLAFVTVVYGLLMPSVFGAEDRASDWSRQNIDVLLELYHAFHSKPELSFREERTAAKLAEELKKETT